MKKIIGKVLNLKSVIMEEYQNKKVFLQITILQIGQKKLLQLQMLKVLCFSHMLLLMLMVMKLLERFTKKNDRKQIKNSLELKK